MENLEVFEANYIEGWHYGDYIGAELHSKLSHPGSEPTGRGWFYWFCEPGCLPTGEPIGPFDSEDEAAHDAEASWEDAFGADEAPGSTCGSGCGYCGACS